MAVFWVQGWVKSWSKIYFECFPQCYSVFLGILKITNSVQGCEQILGQFVRVSKKRFWKNVHYLFLLEKEEEKIWNKSKRKFSKDSQKNSVFGWLWRICFLQNCHFWKLGKHEFVFGKKKLHFCCNYLFLENGIFLTIQNHQTPQKRVSAGTGENPKWHFSFQKSHFGFPLKRGFHYLWCAKAVLCWKHCFMVFSAQRSFAEIKV